MQGHGHGVFHVEKIALLFAIAIIRAVALEQPDQALLPHLVGGFVHQRAHVRLVIFVRAEDVEVFQTDQLVQKTGAAGVQIEQVLGIPVHVQRTQRVQLGIIVLHAGRAVAIGGGGGGVNKPRLIRQRPGGEVLGEFVIVADEITRVFFRGGRASAQMQHQVEPAQRAVLQSGQQDIPLHVIGIPQRREVPPLFIFAENIADNDVLAAAPIERPDEGAADKAGPAGHQDACV